MANNIPRKISTHQLHWYTHSNTKTTARSDTKATENFNSHLQNKLSQQDCIQVRIYISKFMLFYSSINKALLRLASCDITKRAKRIKRLRSAQDHQTLYHLP